MYMLFLTISIALSAGIGFFAAYDTEQRILGRSIEMRADTDVEIQEQMKRALRREGQINPNLLPAPSPNGLVEIPRHIVDATLFGGLRITTDAIYYVESNGFIVAYAEGQAPRPVVYNNSNPGDPVNISVGKGEAPQQEQPGALVNIAVNFDQSQQ